MAHTNEHSEGHGYGKDLAIEGLRGIVIIIIIAYHIYSSEGGTPIQIIKQWGGFYGNTMFFVIAGYLIAWKHHEKIQTRKIGMHDYMVKRLWKIYPTYLLTNVINFAGSVFLHGRSVITIRRVVFSLLMLCGYVAWDGWPYNVPSWFVCLLLYCYVLYYLLARIAYKNGVYRAGLALMILAGMLLYALDLHLPFLYHETGSGILSFFVGCIMAEFTKEKEKGKMCWWAQLLLVALFLGSFYFGCLYLNKIVPMELMVLSFNLWYCPLLLYLCLYSSAVRRLMANRLFRLFGRVSMAMYFWQAILFEISRKLRLIDSIESRSLSFAIRLGSILLFAYLYQYKLLPILEKLIRWAYGRGRFFQKM